ncbi:MAG: long-chain-fatty-acid--CoA ligase [Verrucomicrobiales bacterium]
MNLAAAFAESVEKHHDKTVIFWGEEEIKYADIAVQANILALELLQKNLLSPGARVAVWLKNCPEYLPVLFGIWQAGCAMVPVNNFLKPEEVAFILQDSGATVLITESGMQEGIARLQSLVPGIKMVDISILGEAVGESVPPQTSAAEPDDLAVIIYTSGTTGKPKGAMLTHGNLLSNVESCRQMLQAVDYDRFVVILPMFHSFMLTVGMLLPVMVGGSLLLVKSLHPPKNIMMDIIQRQATILPAIPQFFRTMAHSPVPPGFPLRLCISGAAPLPGEVLKEFNAKYPIPLLEGYGLSEASPVVSMNPIKGPWKAGSIGIPVPGVEVTIQDDEGKELPIGTNGELCVRGKNVMKGYWNQPEETAQALRKGWLLTGDIGYRDEDGYYYITDRKKDMLLVNGINVYPREIEEIIYKFPGIKEAAVVSKPDHRKGEQPVGFVSLFENIEFDEIQLLHFLRDHLADYKVPHHVHVLPQLPRNATGKILKTTLRKIVMDSTNGVDSSA